MTLTKEEKVKNILCFLAIFFGETEIWENVIMNVHPDYLIEKFERYIMSLESKDERGLHPSLRQNVFDRYCDKYKISYRHDYNRFLPIKDKLMEIK
jgi:hypothetical protein